MTRTIPARPTTDHSEVLTRDVQRDDRSDSAPTAIPARATTRPRAFRWPAAPLAGDPRSFSRGTPGRKRRWMYAAAVTGALAAGPTVPHAARSAPSDDHTTGTLDIVTPRVTTVPIVNTSGIDDAAAAPPEEPEAVVTDQIALIDGVPMLLPSAETALVGFHESSSAVAVPIRPASPVDRDLTWKAVEYGPDAHAQVAPSPTMVLPPRERAAGPTTALDIAIPHGAEVVSPVSGTVVGVGGYLLYGEHADTRIDIVPDGRPDLRIAVIHIEDVKVQVGDKVTAGETPLAGSSNAFPFSSQIDRFTEELGGAATPHVHVEAKRVG